MEKAHKIVESMPGGFQLENSCLSFQEFSSPQSELQEKSAKLSKGKFKNNSIVVRQSQCIKSAIVHTFNQDIERVVEDLTTFFDNESDEPVIKWTNTKYCQNLK